MKKFILGLFIAIVATVVAAVSAYAWTAPVMTTLCAPDQGHFSFNVKLAHEDNYKMNVGNGSEEGWLPGVVNMHEGDNNLTVLRSAGESWQVRFDSDHNAKSAVVRGDEEVCEQPSPSATPTPTSTATPSPSVISTPKPTPQPTPKPTPKPVILAQTGGGPLLPLMVIIGGLLIGIGISRALRNP